MDTRDVINLVRLHYKKPGTRPSFAIKRYYQAGYYCPIGLCMERPWEMPEELSGLHVIQLVCVMNIHSGKTRCLHDLMGQPNRELDRLLKPEFAGQPLGFWSALQNFYTDDDNFNTYGISPLGMVFLDHIEARWNNFKLKHREDGSQEEREQEVQ